MACGLSGVFLSSFDSNDGCDFSANNSNTDKKRPSSFRLRWLTFADHATVVMDRLSVVASQCIHLQVLDGAEQPVLWLQLRDVESRWRKVLPLTVCGDSQIMVRSIFCHAP